MEQTVRNSAAPTATSLAFVRGKKENVKEGVGLGGFNLNVTLV